MMFDRNTIIPVPYLLLAGSVVLNILLFWWATHAEKKQEKMRIKWMETSRRLSETRLRSGNSPASCAGCKFTDPTWYPLPGKPYDVCPGCEIPSRRNYAFAVQQQIADDLNGGCSPLTDAIKRLVQNIPEAKEPS